MQFKRLALTLALACFNFSMASNLAHAEGEAAAPVTAAAPEASSASEKELDMFRFIVRMDKLDFVRQSMQLNPEQQEKFMSVYDGYDTELKLLNDQRVGIIKDYAAKFENINDKDADVLVKRSLEYRKKRNALLEKYYGKVAKATSKVTAARFLQVESVLQGASDVIIGSSIPLMEKK